MHADAPREIGGRAIRRGILIRFGDQGLVSLGNFALGLLMAQSLGPTRFGVFALVWTTVVFALGIQWAVVTSPMQFSLPHTAQSDRGGLCVAMLIHSAVIGSVTAFAATVIGMVTSSGRVHATDGAWMSLPIVAVVVQDCVRRWLLATERAQWAFASDVCRHFGSVLAIGLMPSVWRSALPAVITVIGVAALAGCVPIGADLWRARFSWPLVWHHTRLHAPSGRWLLPSVTVQAAIAAAPLYVISAVAGPASTGGYRAAVYMMAPIIVLSEALETLLPLRAGEAMARGGRAAVTRYLTRWAAFSVVVTLAYLTCVDLLGTPLLTRLFGASYAVFSPLLFPLSAAMLLQVGTYILNVYHRAVDQPQSVLIAELAAAASLAAGYLVFPIGTIGEGAAVFSAVSQAVKLIVLAYKTRARPARLFA